LAATILVAAATLLTVRRDKSRQTFQDAMTASAPAAAPEPRSDSAPSSVQASPPQLQTKAQPERVVEGQQQSLRRPAETVATDTASRTRIAASAANAPARDENFAKSAPADAVAKTAQALMDSVRREVPAGVLTGRVAVAPSAAPPAVATAGANAESARRRTPDERRSSSVNQLSEVVVSSATSPGVATFEGCYQLDNESTRAATGLPARFALQHAPDSAPNRGQNIVRAVSPEGRMDTVLRGINWRVVGPGIARVSLDTASARQPLTVRLTDRVVLGDVSAGAPIQLTRLTCRP
jgi:hypothetical protein